MANPFPIINRLELIYLLENNVDTSLE